MPWSGGDLSVYHGTDTVSANLLGAAQGRLVPFSVQLNRCRKVTDFGQGFYVTTSSHQAQQWANAKVRRVRRGAKGLVLRFDLDRDQLAALQSLVFVRPISDFWDFVTHCRSGGNVHSRRGPTQEYDVVYGLVTIWPSLLLIQDCDQISFHTRRAVQVLPQWPTAEAVASSANGLF
jgi:hypothetical protein